METVSAQPFEMVNNCSLHRVKMDFMKTSLSISLFSLLFFPLPSNQPVRQKAHYLASEDQVKELNCSWNNSNITAQVGNLS